MESIRKFEGAERTIVTMENERVVVEVAPSLEGRLIRYADKSKPSTPLEWLDDCPYHYNGRWEGKPFTHEIVSRGPAQAAVTVKGGGKIAVALLRKLGIAVANPLDLAVERTMTIEAGSTRLRVDVKITNTGDGVAPSLRYMVHSVYGNVPPMGADRAFWFLPTANGVEFFDPARGQREMGAANGTTPLNKTFSRFTPGAQADKPRYEAGGWGAVLTSAGPAYIFYEPAKYDFMQFWFGGDSSWHFTFEPHTKPVDLKPGESVGATFTLAYDSKDVPFNGPTVACEQPVVPEFATPGGALAIRARAATVRLDRPEAAQVNVEIQNPAGATILSRKIEATLKPFEFTDLDAGVNLAADAPLGAYSWTARLANGRTLGSGKIQVLAAAELEKRKMDKATAELREKYEERIKKLDADLGDARKVALRWNDGVNLALGLQDRTLWPDTPMTGSEVAIRITRGAVPVQGLWKSHESVRIQKLTPVPAPPAPADSDKLLAALGKDRAFVRDIASDAEGKDLVALIVDPARRRTEIVRLNATGIVKRFGRFSEAPGESDDTLGAFARALTVDRDGSIWVATNARGLTSAYRLNQDGAPFEESVIGDKGALKKFTPDGRLLGTASLLEAPMDLALAEADGAPVVLASYRHVSFYHTAQVREAVMVLRTSDIQRIAELKIPAGSVCVDSAGRVWTADIAGHIACFDVKGRKQFDIATSPPPAVLDARLPNGSPLPAILRADTRGIRALSTLRRTLARLTPDGIAASEEIPAAAGALWKLAGFRDGVRVLGENEAMPFTK
jgi:hypothetical protein